MSIPNPVRTPPADGDRFLAPSDPVTRKVSPMGRWQWSAMAVAIIACFVGGFLLLSACIQPKYAFLCALISFCGAVGGLLYAIRESELEPPHVTPEHKLRVGWIGDCFYGIAGAFAIFLILPNFSESAESNLAGIVSGTVIERMNWLSPSADPPPPGTAPQGGGKAGGSSSEPEREAAPRTSGASARDDKKGGNGADLLEIIAVAIVGGYAGHFVMKRASESLLQQVQKESQKQTQKVEAVATRQRVLEADIDTREARLHAEFDAAQAQFRAELESARVESEAHALVAQQLNPHWPNPDPGDFEQAVARISNDGLARITDAIGQRLQREKKKVARQAVEFLRVLRKVAHERAAGPPGEGATRSRAVTAREIEQEVTLLLAQAIAYAGNPALGASYLDKVLGELPAEDEKYAVRVKTLAVRLGQMTVLPGVTGAVPEPANGRPRHRPNQPR